MLNIELPTITAKTTINTIAADADTYADADAADAANEANLSTKRIKSTTSPKSLTSSLSFRSSTSSKPYVNTYKKLNWIQHCLWIYLIFGFCSPKCKSFALAKLVSSLFVKILNCSNFFFWSRFLSEHSLFCWIQ